ncbi:Retrotransposon protein, Ty3-gypsy subclass, partial [Phytophthora megakarya]
KLWIPDKDEYLVQRILVVAHCGAQGHRGRDATIETIRRFAYLVRLRARVEAFLSTRLLCRQGGKIIQRPWGDTHRTNERNGALHWDFLLVGERFGGDQYLFVLKDEVTHFCELTPCSTPSTTIAAEAILAWHSRYGIPPQWISDQGSHFKNAVVDEVCRRLKSRQEFTVAYWPWINGSIERANRDIIQVLRVLCLEYQVDIHDWTYFVPVLQGN